MEIQARLEIRGHHPAEALENALLAGPDHEREPGDGAEQRDGQNAREHRPPEQVGGAEGPQRPARVQELSRGLPPERARALALEAP